MIWLHLTYVFLILLGTMDDAQAVTCDTEYLKGAKDCMVPFDEAVLNIVTTSGFSTSITTKFLFMKVFCARPEYLQALICVTNAMRVCGKEFEVDQWIQSMLSKYDESIINQMCGDLPALEENLSCLNSLQNSTTLERCVKPTEYSIEVDTEQSCRSTFASAVCALTEVEISCPVVSSAYRSALQLSPSRYCRIDSCTLQYGVCGGMFHNNMPLNAISVRPGDLIAYTYAIQYICGSGKSNIECMINGARCQGFRDVMTIPQIFGIELDPVSYLVKYGCKDINHLLSNMTCFIEQLRTSSFRTCYLQMLYTVGSVPEKQYEIVSCDIFKGTAGCINSIVPMKCGQEVADYFIKWSPAVFRLAEGCGFWKVSSASSMEKITTLMLIQLSIAFNFLLQN
ncbi:hypothetical protein CHS0354_004551 [Potamilus streckersoni]|uniref:DUF19 domain-containing protein n=1 Tax=Potamilus streckersoni TaxID=2493646 RepID=A0AAE0S5K7_9BIVA|nr:hypothetical protein CHS0354_004551 [Potamilus streckersoni]